MVIFFLILVVISAVLLILMVMLQDEQGEGLGGIFGGGSGTPFGSRAGNVLTRFTSILAVTFVACTLILALLNKTPQTDSTIDTARQAQFESGAGGWYIPTEALDTTNNDASLLQDITDLADIDYLDGTSGEGETSTPAATGDAG